MRHCLFGSASSVQPLRFSLASLLMLCALLCLLPVQGNAQAVPAGIAVGGENLTRLLWNSPDGTASFWKIAADGSVASQNSYCPYASWQAQGFTAGPDNAPRILWNHTADSQLSLWNVTPDANFTFGNFGPYSGYTVSLIAAGPNSIPRTLWKKSDGSISLWYSTADAGNYAHSEYGPYTGYSPVALAVDSGNAPRVLWNHPSDATVSLWKVAADSTFTYQNYTDPAGYSPVAMAAGTGGDVRLLWSNGQGSAQVWTIAAGGTYTSKTYPAPSVLALSPTSITNGGTSTGTVTLSSPAPTNGAAVTLTSSNPAAATVPASVTVVAGQTSATFAVTGKSVTSTTAVTITAAYNGVSQTASLTVTVPPPVLTSIAVSPASASVATGGTQQFTAVAKDQNGAALSSQPNFTWSVVSGGVGSISTAGLYSAGSSAGSATVTATSGSVSGTAAVTVTAASPGVTDLAVYTTGSGRVTLYWTALANAIGYNIYRGTSSSGEDYAHPLNGSTPVNTVSYPGSPMDIYSDTGLTDGTEYFYTVKAVYSNGQSAASVEDSDVPDPAAVPWDSRNPGSILSAFRAAFSSDTSGIGADPFSLRVVGPDNAVYDDFFSTPQPPDGTVTPGTNQLVRTDGTTQTLFSDEGQFDLPSPSSPSLRSNAVGTLLKGDRGPFRRVSTRKKTDGSGDYRGASGTFFLPSATVSASALSLHGDSPVIYLGITGRTVAVDAGLAYQNGTHTWALEMQVTGQMVSSQGNPSRTIKPTPLVNAPTQYQRFAPGTSIIMSYWAWGNYPGAGRAKLSLLLVDDPDSDPANPIAAALGAPAKYLGRQENVRAKRVHAIAQNTAGVSRTGSRVDGASWSQGYVMLPDAAGSRQGWRSSAGTLPGEDGYYDGGNASVMAVETSPYIQEDNIDISP